MIKIFYIIGSIVLIFIDQVLKILAIDNLANIDTYPFIRGILHFTYVENRGAAFGIFQGNSFFLIGVTSIAIIFAIFYVFYKSIKNKFLLLNLSLIISGGIGNLIDRIFRGYVVDYIDLKFIDFAIFNFADMCVVSGAILFIIYIIMDDRKLTRTKRDTLQHE